MAPNQIWWFQSIPKILQLLLKYKSISGSLQWNTMDTPEMLHMLIAKLPGRLIDRWYRNSQAIRKKQLHEPDLEDLITIVEEGRVLTNDPLCSRETLHEYTKHLEKSTHVKARQLKNCCTKAGEKVEDSSTDRNCGKHKVQILWWKTWIRRLLVLPWDNSWWSR